MKNLARKLVEVMSECNGVSKDAYNGDVGYPYVTAAKLIDTVNTSLTNHGIATTAESKLLDIREVKTLKGIEILTTVEVALTLIDTDSGETVTLKGIGSGIDAFDKSSAKAQTMATKYALKCGLLIADASDDPDADSKTKRQNILATPAKPAAKPAPIENPAIKKHSWEDEVAPF